MSTTALFSADNRALQDSMNAEWPPALIQEIVMERVNQYSIDTVPAFLIANDRL